MHMPALDSRLCGRAFATCQPGRQRAARAAAAAHATSRPEPGGFTRREAAALVLSALALAVPAEAGATAAPALEDVTPPVAPAGPLSARCAAPQPNTSALRQRCLRGFRQRPSQPPPRSRHVSFQKNLTSEWRLPPCREEAVAGVYDRANRSIINVFDISLQGRGASGPSSVEQPEGNGSGVVWDAAGHAGRAGYQSVLFSAPPRGLNLARHSYSNPCTPSDTQSPTGTSWPAC